MSIKKVDVIDSQTTNKTGAVEKYFNKFCIIFKE